mmetsp:Transcript_25519/g.39538  ORF Transcript_25519/g.39538 Transcript_25519/m.39538 type:complete len:163 (-) Transcript_25519:187-675(-)
MSLSILSRMQSSCRSLLRTKCNPVISLRQQLFPSSCTTHLTIQSRGMASKKHKRVIKQAKGFRGRANRTFKAALQRLEKSWQYAYRDRKQKKRNFRKLWIERINAGVRQHGMSYSKFINGSMHSGCELNRKVLADMAANEPFSFKAVVDVVKMMNVRRMSNK